MSWYALKSRRRQEAFILKALGELGLTGYVPQHVTWARHARRRAERKRPLIAGYVFAHLPTDEALQAALSIRGVVDVIRGQEGRPQHVAPLSLGALILAEACHLFDETWAPPPVKGWRYAYRWKKGDRVRIEDGGAFDGFDAQVERGRGRGRMEVLVMLFGRSTEVVVEHRFLRKAA